MISAIAVIGKNNELGNNQSLLWQVPGDLPRFKSITMGHPIIMGRKTYESVGRELPGRTNIVISRKGEVNSIESAIVKAQSSPGSEEIFIIGGGEIFNLAMPLVERLYLTVVDSEATADTYFPDYSEFGKVIADIPNEVGGMQFRYLTLERN